MIIQKLASLFTLAVLFSATAAAEVTLVPLSFSQDTYVPGDDIVFDVQLPAITNLGTYNLDIIIAGELPNASTDFNVEESGIIPATTNYVFGSNENFFQAVNTFSSTQLLLTGSDFADSGTDVVVGVNDAVASVRVTTLSTYTGDLFFSVDPDGLILDQPNDDPFLINPVIEFDDIRNAVRSAAPFRIRAVPEPSSLATLCFSVGLIASRRRRSPLQ
jgi:hypothetical protein